MPMNRPIAGRNNLKTNLLLSTLASILIFAGIVALVAPELVESLLPAEIAKPLVSNALLVLIVGIGIEGYQIYQLVRAAIARTKRTMASAATSTSIDIADPVARRTTWTPASGGGASFRTKRLVACGPGRFEIRPTTQMILFGGVFIVMGLAFGGGLAFVGRHDPLSLDVLAPVAFGLLFASIGAALLYFAGKPIVFDRQIGWYWKGSPTLRSPGDIRKLKHAGELAGIHALQLIEEHVSSDDSSYESYELNLVMKNGQRVNVMDHGNRESIVADAETLARFLGVPVWDRI